MEPLEANTHSFVVKVWLEETAQEAGRVRWRGHATHVGSGKRLYFERLEEVVDFIASYLETMGVDFGITSKLGKQLKRWRLHLIGRGL